MTVTRTGRYAVEQVRAGHRFRFRALQSERLAAAMPLRDRRAHPTRPSQACAGRPRAVFARARTGMDAAAAPPAASAAASHACAAADALNGAQHPPEDERAAMVRLAAAARAAVHLHAAQLPGDLARRRACAEQRRTCLRARTSWTQQAPAHAAAAMCGAESPAQPTEADAPLRPARPESVLDAALRRGDAGDHDAGHESSGARRSRAAGDHGCAAPPIPLAALSAQPLPCACSPGCAALALRCPDPGAAVR